MTTLCPNLRHADLGVRSADGSAARRWTLIAGVLVAVVQVWLVSAGRWTNWPAYSDRNDRLATALAAGQTHLTIAADPALLALADPYDPVANEPFRKVPGVHDACLYNGKLYYYWGPAPAALLVPGKWILGDRFHVADQQLCFAFALGIVAVSGVMLLHLRDRYFAGSPTWLPAIGVLLAGLSTPITCNLTRPAVYEVAILGGQFFLLAGVYLAWRAIADGGTILSRGTRAGEESSSAAGASGPIAILFSAGTLLALAVGSRVSLAVAVIAVAIVITGTIAWRFRRSPIIAIAPLMAFGLPLVVAAALLCLYNAVRFDDPLQFGQKYQLAGANLLALPGLFGVDNLWPNLWSYFVRPIAGLTHFPFVIAVQGFGQFPGFIGIPHGYEIYEPITGLPWVMPILIAIPAALLTLRPGARKTTRAGSGEHRTAAKPTDSSPWERPPATPRLLVTLLVLSATLGFAPVLLMIGSSQRYLADFTPPLVVVAMIAIWKLADFRRVGDRVASRRLACLVTLSLVTVVVGVLISIEGYGAHFRIKNPELFERMTGQPAALPNPVAVTDISHATH